MMTFSNCCNTALCLSWKGRLTSGHRGPLGLELDVAGVIGEVAGGFVVQVGMMDEIQLA